MGALSGQPSKKGIFITTSYFSQEATDYIEKVDAKIILINNKQLADYMIDHNLGVTPSKMFELKNIDSDYFEAE